MKYAEGKEKIWHERYAANASEEYSKCVFDFAKEWAEEMEERIASGEKLEACAKDASHVVDRRGFGITGFMYGCAVETLAATWEHGEELRRWHNTDLAPNQAEEANAKSGAVLNPAIIEIEIPTE